MPKTSTKFTDTPALYGHACNCRRGQERDNCPACEGTGHRIDFASIRARRAPLVLDLSSPAVLEKFLHRNR